MARTDRTLTSRYELKYWLRPELVRQLRRGIEPFVQLDPYAAKQKNRRYTISSLYLDSPALDLYRSTVEGHRNRFKLRMRYYDDRPEDPVFFEIKKRAETVIRKRRARADRAAAMAYLRGEPTGIADPDPELQEFFLAAADLRARPVVRVRYDREAYESRGRDPVRITMDTELMFAVTTGADLRLRGPGWTCCPTKGVVLEIKFTDNCPEWVAQLVRALRLQRTSVAKYVISVEHARELHGASFLHAGSNHG